MFNLDIYKNKFFNIRNFKENIYAPYYVLYKEAILYLQFNNFKEILSLIEKNKFENEFKVFSFLSKLFSFLLKLYFKQIQTVSLKNLLLINNYQKFIYKRYILNCNKYKNTVPWLQNISTYGSYSTIIKKKIIQIKRISSTNKKGRIFRYKVIVGIGSKKSWVGVGMAKSTDLIKATTQAYVSACKNIYYLKKTKTHTITKASINKYKQSILHLKPLNLSSGLICSKKISYILSIAGYKNVWVLIMKNPKNTELLLTLLLNTLRNKEYYLKLSTNIKENISYTVFKKYRNLLSIYSYLF